MKGGVVSVLVIDGVKIVLNGAYEKELRGEILDKCMFLLTLIKGTIPMNREIGLDPDIISQPFIYAVNRPFSASYLVAANDKRANCPLFTIKRNIMNHFPGLYTMTGNKFHLERNGLILRPLKFPL